MINKDRQMMQNCILQARLELFKDTACPEFPLDVDVVDEIRKLCGLEDKGGLIGSGSDDFEIFKYRKEG